MNRIIIATIVALVAVTATAHNPAVPRTQTEITKLPDQWVCAQIAYSYRGERYEDVGEYWYSNALRRVSSTGDYVEVTTEEECGQLNDNNAVLHGISLSELETYGFQWVGELDSCFVSATTHLRVFGMESPHNVWVNFDTGAAWVRKSRNNRMVWEANNALLEEMEVIVPDNPQCEPLPQPTD